MRIRRLPFVAVACVALAAPPAAAIDGPHDGSFTEGMCQTCHKLHAGGGTLQEQIDNNTTCTTCHNKKVGSLRRFPWATSDQAVPGESGDQHSWTGAVTNAARGALPPLHAEMSLRIEGGRLQCATCHDEHAANAQFAPGSILTSVPIGAARSEDGNQLGPRGDATLELDSVGPAPLPRGTRVQIRTVTPGVGGTFIVSHDFGMAAPTWFNWSGATSSWAPGTIAGEGKPYEVGALVTLDDEALSVIITSGAAPGDYWDLSVSYPFLRASNVEDAMCRDCHRDRVMDHACVGGSSCVADGVKVFSHPVNQALNANGKDQDRAPGAIPEADGSAGDGNASNDLQMTASGRVGCTTCHAPHNADSNSLTDDRAPKAP